MYMLLILSNLIAILQAASIFSDSTTVSTTETLIASESLMIDEEVDRLTWDLYIFGDDDERKKHDEEEDKIIKKFKQQEIKLENELNEKKITFTEFKKQWSLLEKKRKDELLDELIRHDHVIQSDLNDNRIKLVENLNEEKDNYTIDESFQELANAYLSIYLLNEYEREHRIDVYLDLKMKYPEVSAEQFNLTYDHLSYIEEQEKMLIDEVRNFSQIAEILEPKINIINHRHTIARLKSNEIIQEFNAMYGMSSVNSFDKNLLLAVLLSSLISIAFTVVVMSIIFKIWKKREKKVNNEKECEKYDKNGETDEMITK